MRWRVWLSLGLVVCALGGLGSLGSIAREGVQGGIWLEHAVWVKTYLGGYSLAYAPSSKLIATPGGFGQIFLYSALDGSLMRVLRGHEGVVMAVTFSPDGTKLASGDEFGIIRIWNIADGTVSHKWDAHGAKVTGLLFSPNGSLLVSAGDEGKVKVWGTEGWGLVRQFEQYATTASMSFSADGKLLALGDTIVQVFDWRAVRKLEYVRSLASRWAVSCSY